MTRILRYFSISAAFLIALLAFGPQALAQCNAKFTYQKSELSVKFTDSSTAQHTYFRFWSFGDGTKSDAKTPLHTYSAEGSYRVCLVIVDTAAKCKDTFCDMVTVKHSCKSVWNYSVSSNSLTAYADTTVNNKTAKYVWRFGDGSNPLVGKNAIHHYSAAGTYEVCLTVVDSPCEVKTCKQIVIGNPKYCISGKIDCGGDPAYPGRVWLIVFNPHDTSLKAVKDGHIIKDSTGTHYEFCDVEPGRYYVKAALDTSSPKYSDYLPTYFENAVKWKKADSIVVKNANVTGRNIHMKKGNNPGGPGFIKGKISQGANKNEGDPLSDIEVMLFNDATGETVAYTYTDINGEYNFGSLAYGTYQVYPEVLDVPTFPAIVTLSANASGADGIDMKINSREVYVATAIKDNGPAGTRSLSVYPNPVSGTLYIPVKLDNSENLSLTIFDASGKKVFSQTYKYSAGEHTIGLPANGLSKGLYSIQITGSKTAGVYQGRFVKE
jgi:PKD repeat protein